MQGAGVSLFDDDKSAMDKMQNTLKSMVFEIIYYLISGDNFPMFVYIFFVVVETFQFFYFAFSDEVIILLIMVSFFLFGKCHSGLMLFSSSLAFF
jgi:hypothetical protein